MNDELEQKIHAEVRRRAVALANLKAKERGRRLDAEDTLDALEQVTGLSRNELETIEKSVRSSYALAHLDRFSIKNQVCWIGMAALVAVFVIFFLIWLC